MRLLIAIPLLILFLTHPPARSEERIVTVATLEFAPYVSATLPNNGWAWEVAAEAFKRQEYHATLLIVPWARAVQMTKTGAVDALYMANINPERRKWAVFSDPVGEELSVAFVRRDNDIAYDGPDDLRGHRMIGLRNAHVVRKLQDRGLKIKEIVSLEQGIKLLYFKRADVLVTDRYVATHLIHTAFPPDYANAIAHLEPPLDANKLHLAVSRKSKDHEAIRQAFNAGLAEVRADGTYERILQHHGFDPVASAMPAPAAQELKVVTHFPGTIR